jgi:hypothetical protein
MRAPTMTREEADQALATLGPAHDRVAAAMFTLDSHAGLSFLRGGGLTGTSHKVSQDVQALMTLLWAQFSALGQHLDRARDTRAARSRPGDEELALLTRLLREPVVGLSDEGFPFDGAGTPARRLTLVELARGLENSTAELVDVLAEVDEAVGAMVDRLATLTDTLGEIQARAATFAPGDFDTARLAASLDEVRVQGLADPIEVARGGAAAAAVSGRLRRLAADLDSARTRLDEMARVRDEYPQRLAGLRDAVDGVETTEREAARSYEVVRVKIANPGLPEVPATAASLRQRLAGLDQLHQEGRWPRLADEVAALEHTSTEAGAYAGRLRAAADGLLDRRTELRGRLDAYRAKASRLGYGEHPELSARHREAHDVLYTSPCDLPAATRAVFAYQQSLADLTSPRGSKEASR